MWLGLAPELKFPGNFYSGALSRAIAPELKIPGFFCFGAKKKFKLFFALASWAEGPVSKQANYTKHTPRETLKRGGTFSMPFCGFRWVWMDFFVGASDLRDGDSAQNLGAQIDQK